jgi:predicted Zn-dependent protease
MLPLDGGQVVLALMPGRTDTDRLTRASYVSLVVCGLVALAAFSYGEVIAGAFVVFLGVGNLQRVVALRRGGAPRNHVFAEAEAALLAGRPEETLLRLADLSALPPDLRAAGVVLRAAALLRVGRAREAQDVLLPLPPGALDPVFEATVLYANGQERLARERLAGLLGPDASPWAVRELVLLLRRRDEDVVAVVGDLTGNAAAGVLDALYASGDHAAAAAWGERALATGASDAWVAYNTACAYARAGDPERALRSLGYAASLGWADVATAESDPDLAPVRDLAAWPDVRAVMAANSGGAPSRPTR